MLAEGWELSEDRRGDPVVIVVATDWLRDMSAVWAAEARAGIMEGPVRRWALVMWAHVAIWRGPRVYWSWSVSVGEGRSAFVLLGSWKGRGKRTPNVTELAVLE